jgi:hypothetical protein
VAFVAPDERTPEQALAAFDPLENLLTVIISHYDVQLREQLQPNCRTAC